MIGLKQASLEAIGKVGEEILNVDGL